jgi:hypothetical protein
MNGIVDRMIRAAKLDVNLYEEVEADTGATGQAMVVVIVTSIAAGIGTSGEGGPGLVVGVIAALVGWYIWAFLTYFIGTRFLPGPNTKADIGELLRTTGFSSSPGLIRALGIVPGLGPIALFAGSMWMLVAMIIAVRQALDYETTGRAIAVCVIGWLVQVAFLVAAFLLLGSLGLTRDAG